MGASNETASPATLQGPTLPLLTVWQDTDLSRSPALHMAVDEALLRTTSGPVLRFYEWDAPAVTIGYFQEWQAQPGLPDERIVRRWTGGGRVEHGEDSTFSLVLPADSRLAKASADTRYRVIHEALAAALNGAGETCGLLPSQSRGHRVDRCFVEPVEADLVQPDSGSKIAGGAQRRCRGAVLHQGSVRTTLDEGSGWKTAFARNLAEEIMLWSPDPEFLRTATALMEQRYGHPEWRYRQGRGLS